jgi:hypothetical protein
LAADYETPLSAFQKIHDGRCGFLLESAELTQHSGRYSLLGSSPRLIFTARGREIEVEERGQVRRFTTESDPLSELEKLMKPYRPAEPAKIPVFHGGAVGYLGYDMVRFFEPTLPSPPKDELGLPEMVFMLTDTVIIFDHKHRKLSIVANVFTGEHSNLDAAYDWAKEQILAVIERLSQPLAVRPLIAFPPAASGKGPAPTGNTTQNEYEGMVRAAKEYIAAGDAFQVVPSQRWAQRFPLPPFALYRSLRRALVEGDPKDPASRTAELAWLLRCVLDRVERLRERRRDRAARDLIHRFLVTYVRFFDLTLHLHDADFQSSPSLGSAGNNTSFIRFCMQFCNRRFTSGTSFSAHSTTSWSCPLISRPLWFT